MMLLRRPALLGAGVLAAPRRPARRTDVRVVPAERARRAGAAVGLGGTRELPPQRGIGHSVTAPVWRRRALPRAEDAGVY